MPSANGLNTAAREFWEMLLFARKEGEPVRPWGRVRIAGLLPILVSLLAVGAPVLSQGLPLPSVVMLYEATSGYAAAFVGGYAFVGGGVVIDSNPFRLLSIWHVAALRRLHLRVGMKDGGLQGQPLSPECRAPITILSARTPFHQSFSPYAYDLASVSSREPAIGEWLTAAGYPDADWTVLRLKVKRYETIAYGGEVVRYMLLAPVDFEYFPPVLQGMSGGAVFDKHGKVVAIISLEARSPRNRRDDLLAAVPTLAGLGRCRARVGL